MDTFEQEIHKQIEKLRKRQSELPPNSPEIAKIHFQIQDLINTLLWWQNE